MARIRTIKPEFFTSEDIVSLSPLARLLYIALWCESDKEGRFFWKPKTFKMRYFPAESCDIDGLCEELLRADLVLTYGDGLAFIPTFKKHQHINPREKASDITEPVATVTRRDASCTVTDAQGGREGKGREGKGTKDGASAPADPIKDLFNRGVSLIGGDGKDARSFLGKLRKNFGDIVVMKAITGAEDARPSDPVGWLLKSCEFHKAAETKGNGMDYPKGYIPYIND